MLTIPLGIFRILTTLIVKRQTISDSAKRELLKSDQDKVAYSWKKTATHGLTRSSTVSYTHLRAHETEADLVCRLLLEKKN